MVPTIRPSCSAKATKRCSIGSVVVAPEALDVVVSRFACFVPLSRFVMRAPFCGVQSHMSVRLMVVLALWHFGHRKRRMAMSPFRVRLRLLRRPPGRRWRSSRLAEEAREVRGRHREAPEEMRRSVREMKDAQKPGRTDGLCLLATVKLVAAPPGL